MEIAVTFVSTNARGQLRKDQRRLAGSEFVLGRARSSDIRLEDPRVALRHARVSTSDEGASIEALDGMIRVNRRRVTATKLAAGDSIAIGPYQVRVEPASANVPLALSITPPAPSQRGAMTLGRIFRARPRVSIRRLSYLAFGGVLLLCLLAPLSSELFGSSEPTPAGSPLRVADFIDAAAVYFLQTWNPGPLSRSHGVFGAECRLCHQYPFVQVRDSACVSCHKTIKEHVPRAELTGPLGLAFAKKRCAECHRDHKEGVMAPRAQELCAACHANVKAAAPNARSENVKDFLNEHPEFRLTLVDADHPESARRVRQDDPPRAGMIERSNLRYSHKVHLDPAGVRDPNKKRTVLKCVDCHELTEGGRLMAPITMERHCQECHLLAFEPKVTDRQVPHGSEEAVNNTVREFYSRLVLGEVPPGVTPPPDLERARPGAELDYQDRQQALRVAEQRADRVIRELYDIRKVCSTCHYAKQGPDGEWKVAPVRLSNVWMPRARFSHSKHQTEACTSCHAVGLSADAADIAMPRIKKCRECHVGARPVAGKVASDCATCHSFHAGSDYWHKPLQVLMQPKGAK